MMVFESKSKRFFEIAKSLGYDDITKQDVVDVISAMFRHHDDFTPGSISLELGWGLSDEVLLRVAHIEEVLTAMGFIEKIGGVLIRGVVYQMNDAKIKDILTIGVPTLSGFIWTEDAVRTVLEQAKEKTQSGTLMGQFPPIENDINLEKVSHIVKKMWVENTTQGQIVLKASICTLHTPYGELLETYWQRIRLGLRCLGKKIPGTTIIDHRGLEFVTVDVVDMDKELISFLKG